MAAISFAEQVQINGGRHRRIAGVIGVHMVAAIVFWKHPRWDLRIAEHGIKVDHAVEQVPNFGSLLVTSDHAVIDPQRDRRMDRRYSGFAGDNYLRKVPSRNGLAAV